MRRPLLLLLMLALLGACSAAREEQQKRQTASEYNTELGLAYLRQGRDQMAMEKLRKAVEQDPKNAQAHHYLAVLYQKLGENDKADQAYWKALRYAPKDPNLLNNYGAFLCGQGKYDRAIRLFRKVLEDPLYPARQAVYENIGLCAQQKGDLKLAEEYLRKSLKANPRAPKSLLALGQIRFDQGDAAAARQYLYDYLAVARHNAESLWLGVLLAAKTGNKDRLASYKLLLKGKFPDSPQTAKLKKMEAEGKI